MSESVTCPCGCNHTFIHASEVSTPRSRKGAKEALTWKELPPANYKLLSWGISSGWAFQPLTKDEIHRGFRGTTIDAINARISEFRALDLVERIIDKSPINPRDTPRRSSMVKYKLNMTRALQLVNNGGRIR